MRTFTDSRGRISFNFDSIDFSVKQSFTSFSHGNVLRGIHCSPYPKFIVCTKGHVFDVTTYPDGTYTSVTLRQNDTLLVPAHAGHAYYCFEDSEIVYYLGGEFNPEVDKTFHWRDPTLAIEWPCFTPHVSEKDSNAPLFRPLDCVLIGSTGFIGRNVMKHFPDAYPYSKRLDTDIKDFLEFVKPTHVLCAGGISGRPTIDWCEDNKEETTHVNLTLQLYLAHVCKTLGIHLTIFGSGSVYNGSKFHTEEDIPDYHDKFYCHTRILLEDVVQTSYPDTVLYLRVQYPIAGDGDPKCFLSKLRSRKDSVHNVDVCVSVLPSLLAKNLPTLLDTKKTGVYNFVNEGSISLSRILDHFRVEHTVTNFDNSRGTSLLSAKKLGDVETVDQALINMGSS
jgi:dTDP-4-dehydrorhamnose 3,5-epimerase-like enzyme/dTDP-4-dehydrorhamnose reductase